MIRHYLVSAVVYDTSFSTHLITLIKQSVFCFGKESLSNFLPFSSWHTSISEESIVFPLHYGENGAAHIGTSL